MPQITGAFNRDANHVPIWTDGIITKKSVTFSNTAGSGAVGTVALFTVTGMVIAKVIGFCNTDLTGAATLEVGVTGSTNLCLAQIANATTLDQNEIYADATAAAFKAVSDTVPPENIITTNIFATVGSTNITAGQVDFYCIWRPISANGNVVAA
jgi:hypothetical protein